MRGSALKLHDSPTSPVAIIHNEELILLEAEVLFIGQPSDLVKASAELNLGRTKSTACRRINVPADKTAFIDALLYQRRYSLRFEAHRCIDLRRSIARFQNSALCMLCVFYQEQSIHAASRLLNISCEVLKLAAMASTFYNADGPRDARPRIQGDCAK